MLGVTIPYLAIVLFREHSMTNWSRWNRHVLNIATNKRGVILYPVLNSQGCFQMEEEQRISVVELKKWWMVLL